MNKWQWSSKLEHWLPADFENHHNNSPLSERLLTRGLISAKTLEEIERENRWIQTRVKHERELALYRKRLDILVAAQKECRIAGKWKGQGCVFCGRKETSNVYICSECCTKLLSAGEESLKMGYLLAVWHGLEDKANALLNFIDPKVAREVENEVELTRAGTYMEESNDERQKPKDRKFDHRVNSLRTFQLQKKSTLVVKKRNRIAVSKGYQKYQAVSGI